MMRKQNIRAVSYTHLDVYKRQPLSWVPLAWPARLGSLGVEAFIDAARAAGPFLTTALASLVLTLAADAVLLAWFCRFEDGRADA